MKNLKRERGIGESGASRGSAPFQPTSGGRSSRYNKVRTALFQAILGSLSFAFLI
jgi:hypothetical protein